MTIGTGPHAEGAATNAREERLARRAAELYAHDPQFQDARPLREIAAALQQPGMRLSQMVATVMEGYADRPALGQPAREFVTDPATGRTSVHLLPRLETITYGELWARVGAVASEWQHDPEHPLSAGDFVCILGFTSTDYTTIDLGCIRLGAVSVPLQTSAPVAQLLAIIAETQPRILAVGIDYLETAAEAALAGAVPQRLIVFDYEPHDDDQRDKLEAACRRLAGTPLVIHSLNNVAERGKALPTTPLHIPDTDDAPVTLVYTSGSTGTPKGVIYTQDMWATPWLQSSELPLLSLNYMPSSHGLGRTLLARTLANGGTGYIAAKSDMSTLFDDFALVRPTVLNLVPRVCDMIFQRYQHELDRRAVECADPDIIDHDVKADLRHNLLGGRFLQATCRTAPLSAEMTAFMESVLDMHLSNIYGFTETASIILLDNQVQCPPVIDYKLLDVPELGYFRTDKPYPRGELLVKAEHMTPGYYKRPDVTATIFDEDGFYKTNDVMAETGPDRLSYVDRRNFVLKLSQGEFVAISHLEAVFSSSPLIWQIFVYGNSERSFLLAVIVPTPEALEQVTSDSGTGRLRASISESLQKIAKDAGLNGYEIPRDFLIETAPFSENNGLLSGTGKLARPALRARYGERLEQIYADIAAEQADELRALRAGGRDAPVLDTLSRATQVTLGLSSADVSPDARFIDLGGDSLSALSFSTLLEQIFGIQVPVSVVVDPTSDLRQLANYMQQLRGSASTRPTFATVHGRNGSEAHAGDLTLDKFIAARTLKDAKTLPRPSGAIRTVLLTGATGYLGRFLALEWLQRLSESGSTLICIARGSDAIAARKRIEKTFDTDAELIERFRRLSADHLEVIAGDIGEPNLGLNEATWKRLGDTVDLIVHPAAHVNHILPYRQLFGPNVVGTAELIRLAVTSKQKTVNYISTAAVIEQSDEVISEDADIRIAIPVRTIEDAHANGYTISKWAGEVLMREAHDLCDLPVAVFRSNMIMAHSRYAGQLNVPDTFTRLIFSLLTTEIAPHSFYCGDEPGSRPRAHYDGLPVDFTAEAITTLGAQATDGFHTYNVTNPYDDGVSLDQFVDWLIDARCPIRRIDDYDKWMIRFETPLRALPAKQRQHSVLPVLAAYRHPAKAVRGSAVSADRFRAAVQALGAGADHDIPHLSAALIRKYIADLQQLHLL